MLNKKFQHGNTFLPYLTLVVIAGLVTTNLWLYFWGQKEITPSQPQSVVTTIDPQADWQTYTNTDYGFSFQYPADWTEKKDNLPDSIKKDEGGVPTQSLALSTLNGETQFSLLIDPLGFGPFFPDMFLTVAKKNGGLAITQRQNSESNKDNKPNEYSLIISSIDNESPRFWMYASSPAVEKDKLIAQLDKLIATFRFTDDMSDWKTYNTTQYSLQFKFPSDLVYLGPEGGDFIGPLSSPKAIKYAPDLVVGTPENELIFTLDIIPTSDNDGNFYVLNHIQQVFSRDTSKYSKSTVSIDNIAYDKYSRLQNRQPDNHTQIKDVYITSQNGFTYIITLYGLQIGEKILSTFRFTDEPVIKIPDDWKNYTDSQVGFSFAYPNPWKLTTENGDPSVIASLFYQPIEEAYNLDGGISVYVRIHESNGLSLADWFHKNAEYSKEKIQQRVDYMKLEGSGSLIASDIITNFQNITIDSTPAIAQYTKELKPTYIEGGASTRKEYYFKKGDKIISIIGQTSTGSQAQGMLNLFDQFVATFKFNK